MLLRLLNTLQSCLSTEQYYQQWINEQIKNYDKKIIFRVDKESKNRCFATCPHLQSVLFYITVSNNMFTIVSDKELKAFIAHEIAHIMDTLVHERDYHKREYLADLESVKYGGNYDDLISGLRKTFKKSLEEGLISNIGSTKTHPSLDDRISNLYCLKRYFEI